MSSMMSCAMLAMLAMNIANQKKIKVKKQIEKIEKDIAISVKKMEVMHSDDWFDDNKVWLSMY